MVVMIAFFCGCSPKSETVFAGAMLIAFPIGSRFPFLVMTSMN